MWKCNLKRNWFRSEDHPFYEKKRKNVNKKERMHSNLPLSSSFPSFFYFPSLTSPNKKHNPLEKGGFDDYHQHRHYSIYLPSVHEEKKKKKKFLWVRWLQKKL
ncbi:hypothetical protein HMI56_001491 [Coelomomyces lativittatus]|nr:hypothetical protein HMI56_001491 [Coelomomyces lativittatus]